jgi:nicotinamidase-related amidase
MLNDFIREGAPLEVPGGREIIPQIRRELDRAHREGTPVYYLCDSHSEDDPELKVWPRHCIRGTQGAEVVAPLQPTASDLVILKTRYDAFIGTELEEHLRRNGITDLILTGVATEICVHYTGAAAIMRGFHVEIVDDCVSALSEDQGRCALRMLREVLQPK